MNNKYEFYDLFPMIKENKIRVGNVLVVYNKEDSSIVDYYEVTEKDIVMLADKKMCLFDNFYIQELLKSWEFSVIYKEKDKQKILDNLSKM